VPPAFSGGADALRAANASLVRRVRELLPLVTAEEDFESFKSVSATFRDGQLPATAYLEIVTALGLEPVVDELIVLLPDPQRRAALAQAVAEQRRASWAPAPVARMAAAPAPPAAATASRASWSCGACSLINEASANECDACGGLRRASETEPGSALAAALERALLKGNGRVRSERREEREASGERELSVAEKNALLLSRSAAMVRGRMRGVPWQVR
jgi:hypothetical protein